ncbi:MAG: N-acetylmuramoyl-L-alanine amidase [Clostridia bacterium]|nr:N-acetylmuramoyl-L-alanine amidase [Clostridia bacterium]
MRYQAILKLFLIIIAAFLFTLAVSAENPVIVIDAGHGGYDGGTAQGVRTEKEYNLLLSTYLYDELTADGRFDVYMTRTSDVYLKYLPRVLVGLEANADLILSLHCNSNPESYPNGNMAYVTVIDKFAAWDLAGRLLDGITSSVGIRCGSVEVREDTGDSLGVYYWDSERQWDMPAAWKYGQKSDYYSINTWASKFGIPSIIVEHGYLSNPDDAAIIDRDENLRAMAKAEAQALIDYYYGHEHQFSAVTTDYPSSCTLAGTQSSRCSICGLKTGTTTLSANPDGHFWRQTASAAATCTTDGYIQYICQISFNLNDKGYPCDVHEYTETIPATGHSYQVIEDTAASHGHDGRFLQRCANCGDEIEEIRPGEPHTYEISAENAPTCTEDGGVTYTCTRCSDSYTETEPAPGHTWTVTESVDATDTADGYVKSVCDTCGETKTDEIHRCQHEFTVTETPADCENNGKTESVCSLCGYVKTEVIKSPGHNWVTQMSTGASCEKEGFRREKCSVCGETQTKTIAALGHTYILKEEKDGLEYHVCTACGSEITKEPERRAISGIFKNPVAIAIIAIIAVQFAAVAVILVRSHKTRSRKHDFAMFDEDEAPAKDKVKK